MANCCVWLENGADKLPCRLITYVSMRRDEMMMMMSLISNSLSQLSRIAAVWG